MKLTELFESQHLQENDSMHDVESDKRKYDLDDTRKPKLTLEDINKLRKYKEFKQAQDAKRDSVVAVVYATPAEQNPGGFQ